MTGTVSTPILAYEGDVVSFTVHGANITLGEVVALESNSTHNMHVCTGTAALAAKAIGVAESCRVTSALVGSSSQLTAAVGELVSVRLKGIVNVTAAGTIAPGDHVQANDAGQVITGTDAGKCLGIALTNAAANETVKVLLRGL